MPTRENDEDERRERPPPRDPELDATLKEFLGEWRADRREGRTMKVLHDNVKELDGKLDAHILDTTRRVTELETNQKRDAEDRIVHGPNGTGRFNVVPQAGHAPDHQPVALRSPNPKPPQSWWGREPFKTAVGYGTAVLVAATIGLFTGRSTVVPTPQSVEELPHVAMQPPTPPVETVAVPVVTVAATAPPAPSSSADAGPHRRP